MEERRDRVGLPYWIYLPSGVSPTIITRPVDREAAPVEQLNAAYAFILSRLSLHDNHRQGLVDRGMAMEVIERHGFRSWPDNRAKRLIAASLFRGFGEVCKAVPGWYVRDGRPMLSGGTGWVIPMWDLSGKICALRMRSDQPNAEPRYYWISSGGGKKGGASSGIHPRIAWPGRHPVRADRADTVRVTEGEVKAIILAEATGVPTISVPGVSAWRLALPWLRWLRATKILLCYDADVATNKDVARGFLATRAGLLRHGFEVAIETWKERVSA